MSKKVRTRSVEVFRAVSLGSPIRAVEVLPLSEGRV
jgi:hypothetical protein